MTSKAFSQNRFLERDLPREEIFQEEDRRSRKATVYDAVAGRVSVAGFIPRHPIISSTRDTPSSSVASVAPESVLFRRKGAPTRYAESDIYFANERETHVELPESDLLKALHCYTSDFYSRATVDGGAGDWRSLDETALLALGILMEEAARHTLGETGDLVFTEGEEIDVSGSSEGVQAQIGTSTSKSHRARPLKRRKVSEGIEHG